MTHPRPASWLQLLRSHEGRSAIAGPGALSWAQLADRAADERDELVAKGLRPGEPAVFDCGDAATDAVRLHAIWAARAIAVPLDPALPPAERARRVALVRPRVERQGSRWAQARESSPAAPPLLPNEPGLVVFTSGTTGRSRGALLGLGALLVSARSVADNTGLGPDDRWYGPLPRFHVGGVGVLLRCALTGAVADLADGFDPEAAAAALRRATHGSLVARMLHRILDETAESWGAPCRLLLVGGGAVPPELLNQARARGLPVVTTYGMTEAGSTVTLQRPDYPPGVAGDAGWPLPQRRVRVVQGRIEVGGPTLFEGYLGEPRQPPEQARQRWHRTGDLGHLEPDGRLIVHERMGDLIITGGENVYPAEVERVLLASPLVADVAVVGLPDPEWGQRVAAVIVWAAAPDPVGLRVFARDHLTPPQRPKTLQTWPPPLPRNALGKLQRSAVRSALAVDGRSDADPTPTRSDWS